MSAGKRAGIIIVALVLAALLGVVVARADGPWLWQEKCPMQHEVVIDQTQKGVVVVGCLRMAQEVTLDNNR